MEPVLPRIACVAVAALPLQLLLRRHPEWRGEPVAVVAEDHPRGRIEWVDEGARAVGILPGQRYGAALAVAAGLRAGVVSPAEIGAAVAAITRRLRRFTPGVEPATDQPGLFWLDASGLTRLYPSLTAWGEAIRTDLATAALEATVAVGFTRFGTYAVARAGRGVRLFAAPQEERGVVGDLPLARLGLAPELRDSLARLGVTTVARFLALPPVGLLERFGPEAYRLHRLADDDLFAPLAPVPEILPLAARALLNFPERDARRLLVAIERLLAPLLDRLVRRQTAVAALHLHLRLDSGAGRSHCLRPAIPTRESPCLLELVRLRLESTPLPCGVVEVALRLEEVTVDREQLSLVTAHPHRDRRAAEAALARIVAEMGEGTVRRFRLRDGHLPESRYTSEAVERLPAPRSRPGGGDHLVRRILARPRPIPPPHQGADGRFPAEPGGEITRLIGPELLSGGWWQGEVDREYWFARTARGDLLWLFYDRCRRQWFQQGRVE
jgi:protein ImuB